MASGAASAQESGLIIRSKQLPVGRCIDADADRCCGEKAHDASQKTKQQDHDLNEDQSQNFPPLLVHHGHAMPDRADRATTVQKGNEAEKRLIHIDVKAEYGGQDHQQPDDWIGGSIAAKGLQGGEKRRLQFCFAEVAA